jgi:hypothetical protein
MAADDFGPATDTNEHHFMMVENSVPLFVFGPPRSGTTFFTVVLNFHPEIFVTNESRIMSFLYDLSRRVQSPGPLLPSHPARAGVVSSFSEVYRNVAVRFFRNHVNKGNLGIPPLAPDQMKLTTMRVWGDKNPGYADSDKEPGCLDFIHSTFPKARFIQVMRDPRSSVASLFELKNVYKRDLDSCIDLWLSHAVDAQRFMERMPKGTAMTVKHEELSGEGGPALFAKVERFLGLRHALAPKEFLKRELTRRTPIRGPVTPTAQLGTPIYSELLKEDQIKHIEERTLEYASKYGY